MGKRAVVVDGADDKFGVADKALRGAGAADVMTAAISTSLALTTMSLVLDE